MTEDATPPPAPPPAKGQPSHQRRWPKRLAIGVAVTAALLAGAYWYLGRESTLQTVAERVADESGGSIVITGVTGSLHGAMHLDKIVFLSPQQRMTAEDVTIDWSPLQYLSQGLVINKLHVMKLKVETLKESEPATMPTSLEAPFFLQLDDARINQVIMLNKGTKTVIADVRFDLHGGEKKWMLRGASAITPWGYAKADGKIAAHKPFKLDATASLTQLVAKGQPAAQINFRAGGDLITTQLAAAARSGKAVGDARFILSPFGKVPLRQMQINGKNINPGFFNPALPTADLTVTIAARVEGDRDVKGSVHIVNEGALGTIDQQLLPLQMLHADLGGDLAALTIDKAVLDFGKAGKFTGEGSIKGVAGAPGVASANFALHTDSLNLKQLHSRMKSTNIAGDIRLASTGATQTLSAQLVDAKMGMRLDAGAVLADNLLQIKQATVAAGKSRIRLTANASMLDQREFKVAASAVNFNPASFGDYPAADINADINANGVLAPEWKVAANFALRPSRLFDQPLTGKGNFNADAKHITDLDATLALGKNRVDLNGNFGAPGEKITWRLDGKQLGALRDDLYGAVQANGVITDTMEMPRTSFEVRANGLGWVPAAKAAGTGSLRASGEAWLTEAAKDGQRVVALKAKGSMQELNPAAFGSFLPGSINGNFDLAGQAGPNWRGTVDLALKPSTLAQSPLVGHARIAADARHISKADIDLQVGANVLTAKGSFGAGSDVLNWRIDAPQLAALGPDFGGVLRGSGTLSGTIEEPSLKAALEGQKLKLMGQHRIESLRASANIGSGRGASDSVVSDIALTGYTNGERRIDSASLKSSGTRAAHTVVFSGSSDMGQASGEIRGGFANSTWNGTIASLQNKGRYAFTLQAPVPLRIAGAPGSGVMGLLDPVAMSLRNAVIRLPDGTLTLESLDKSNGRWSSKGAAAGVPVNYLAQFSPALQDNVRGDLTVGGQWAFTLKAPAAPGAAPALDGSVHLFREKGDLIVGDDIPVVLGLRTLDLRADVSDGALRTQVQFDAARAGVAHIDATTQLVNGRLSNASPLKLSATADMKSIAWMAPLAGQPGLELDGALQLALTGGGTVGEPTLSGTVNGDGLVVLWPEQGVKLRNGELRARLTGDQLLLERLRFDGVQGTATAAGNVRFSGGEATMQLKVVADKLEILSRPDRTVVVSGSGALVRNDKRFAIEGKFKVDRALIELAPQDRPTLSEDIIVLGRTTREEAGKKAKPAEMPLAVNIEADLGDSFRLRGMGIDADLRGQVDLTGTANRLRAHGSIRVAKGTYKAYGQNLTIERGILTFSGPADNPAINIRAVRRRPEGEQLSETNVEAGVEIRGTALSPVAKLVSTPNVSDSDKLSWLVLGHGTESISGNEAGILTAAAGALLGGKGGGFQQRMADSLGLDELGLSQAEGLESTVITFGKRLSARAYLSFEQGATSATSLVRLRYKLNPRITLQFQTGANTAFDVLYTWAFD